MKEMTGPAMLKRKRRFEKCVVRFPDRADWYLEQIRDLEQNLKLMNACQRCGRELKGEESQARGYGPECARKEEALEDEDS